MVGAPHRRIATVDRAVMKRFLMPAPVQKSLGALPEGESRRNKRLGTIGWSPVNAPRSIKSSERTARCSGGSESQPSSFDDVVRYVSADVALPGPLEISELGP